MKRVLISIGLLACSALATVLQGWVLTYLWAWFLVPLVQLGSWSLPAITVWQGVGVMVVWSFLTIGHGMMLVDIRQDTQKLVTGSATDDESRALQSFKNIAVSMITAMLSLGTGYVWHLFL